MRRAVNDGVVRPLWRVALWARAPSAAAAAATSSSSSAAHAAAAPIAAATMPLPPASITQHQQHYQQHAASFASSLAFSTTAAARGPHAHPPPRNARFAALEPADIDAFRAILGGGDSGRGVVTDPTALEGYNTDWLGKYRGAARVALRPATTEQVSRILAHCSRRRLAVVPQGGNTGLVGGSVPAHDEVVLSLSAMDRVLAFDASSGALTAQAGCVLQSLDEAAAEHGFMVPLDLGAKGSCQIGGNVSTNAGGLRLLRYGSLHGSVLGVEAVLSDGTVLDLLCPLRKDNTGYDLKQLFIGSEGSLGVVTAVCIQCAPRPASVQLAFLAVPSFDAVRGVLALARARLSEVLSAAEFLDAASVALATEHLPNVTNPLGGGIGGGGDSSGGSDAPFYMVIETHGSDAAHDAAKLDAFLEAAMADGLVTDGTVAASAAQAAAIWRVREGVTEALNRCGAVYKYDLSIPLPAMYALVDEMRARLAGAVPGALVAGFGHVGDGNLHLNIAVPRGSGSTSTSSSSDSGSSANDPVLALIEPFVYEWTAAHRGSISAEHGLGAMKAGVIGYSKPPAAVALMARLKRLLDPAGILNPYKVLPAEALAAAAAAAEHEAETIDTTAAAAKAGVA